MKIIKNIYLFTVFAYKFAKRQKKNHRTIKVGGFSCRYVIYGFVFLVNTLVAPEEEGNCTGACVAADGSADGRNLNLAVKFGEL